jgi:hypothetical protein
VVTHDYPDLERPPPGSHCQGGIQLSPGECLFTAHGNLVYGNVFTRDGFFGNVTNGDLATVGLLRQSATPRNCFFGNAAAGGKLTSSPAHIQRPSVDGPLCGRRGTSINNALIGQLICASGATGLGPCAPGSHYPKPAAIVMAPLPHLPMPDPCTGVPRNGFCQRS